jgi:hypothetical protein
VLALERQQVAESGTDHPQVRPADQGAEGEIAPADPPLAVGPHDAVVDEGQGHFHPPQGDAELAQDFVFR